jgi:hypothetical protein
LLNRRTEKAIKLARQNFRTPGCNSLGALTVGASTSEGSRLIFQFYELDPSVKFAISRSKTDNPNA